jgi:hypothetical protein
MVSAVVSLKLMVPVPKLPWLALGLLAFVGLLDLAGSGSGRLAPRSLMISCTSLIQFDI